MAIFHERSLALPSPNANQGAVRYRGGKNPPVGLVGRYDSVRR